MSLLVRITMLAGVSVLAVRLGGQLALAEHRWNQSRDLSHKGVLKPLKAGLSEVGLSEAELSGESDYFENIRPSQKGYLIWTGDSVAIYVEPVRDDGLAHGVSSRSAQAWFRAVEGAIADWSSYVLLTRTEDPSQAQIQILRRQPPLNWPPKKLRARNAETRFQLLTTTDASGAPCWFHRQTIFLGERQGEVQLQGTARHELGHALGLWGHSPDPNDALYARQVGDPPAISTRDLNTLRRVYQQPTQLGCL